MFCVWFLRSAIPGRSQLSCWWQFFCAWLSRSHFPNVLLSLIILSVGSGLAFNFSFSKTRVNSFCSLALTQVQTHFQNLNKMSRWLTKDEHWGLVLLSKTTGNRSGCQPFSRQCPCTHLVNILVSPLFQSSKLSKS